MRDILVCLLVFGSLPFILRSPVNGVMMWVWISVMNPHTQGWGFATSFPFAALVAGATIFSMLVTREPKSVPWSPVTVVLLLFGAWMIVTLPFSLHFEQSVPLWSRVMKILLMTFVVLALVKTRAQVERLLWVLALSLGFYGFKGGIFTISSGGAYRVWGPEGTFIGDNNAIALALIMAIPLLYYLLTLTKRRLLRYLLLATILLSALAALGSYSRGGFVAIAAMGLFMVYKSRRRIAVGSALLLAAPLLLLFMPQQWVSRMDTIDNYELDASAQGRLNAWAMAYRLASDRLFGGGFEVYTPSVFAVYAPNPNAVHAAHSIYFQVLGEHGFIGLGLYLLLGILTWRTARWIIRTASERSEFQWAGDMAMAIQTSLVGFMVGGAFLSLAYFDVPYYLLCALVVTRRLMENHIDEQAAAARAAGGTGAPIPA
ncbi:putative O-glycosylation ligase, exosortase A system-associated [Pseudoduganella sp. GCM10020061]|uniref:putative O-glycosylation ligase, exosortase A system-associated n=1 Tax=Pseudoduganella sp. GCM10020061 TaxID=3317345 RepID=UPI00362E5710